MRKKSISGLIAGLLALTCATADATSRPVRATELSGTMLSDFTEGKSDDLVIEFRQGDELPVSFTAEGDLIETRRPSVSYIGIKKNFWLRMKSNEMQISLDGSKFKKLNKVLTGSLEADAGAGSNGGIADAINISLKTFLK